MTRQAVSRQIALMEQELDAKLFSRTTAKVRLTEAGEIYYEFYTQWGEAWLEVQRKVRRVNTRRKEMINIGCIYSADLGAEILQMVELLRKQGITLEVNWEHGEPGALVSALELGYFDIVFTFDECCKEGGDLDSCLYAETYGVVVVRNDYFGRDAALDLRRLEHEPCFVVESMFRGMQKREFTEMWRKRGLNLTDVQVLPNRESIQTMVELGRGITLSTSMERLAQSPNICQIPVGQRTQLMCAWRSDEARESVHALLDLIRGHRKALN
jgi:DNA-binding transcriptional LysR family regulator